VCCGALQAPIASASKTCERGFDGPMSRGNLAAVLVDGVAISHLAGSRSEVLSFLLTFGSMATSAYFHGWGKWLAEGNG
jgi:hypothetical protein